MYRSDRKVSIPLLCLLTLSLFLITPSYANSPIEFEIIETTAVRDKPYFVEQQFLLGFVNPGDRVEVISISRNHQFGAAFQVRVLSGEHRGLEGWVFFHDQSSLRTMAQVDAEGNRIDVPGLAEDESRPSLLQQVHGEINLAELPYYLDDGTEVIIPEQSRALSRQYALPDDHGHVLFNRYLDNIVEQFQPSSVEGIHHRPTETRAVERIMSESDIWNGAVEGTFQLDIDNYDGGEFIPFVREYTDSFGIKTRTRYYARANPEALARMPEVLQEALVQRQSCPIEAPRLPEYQDVEWLPHCEVLGVALGDQHFDQLGQCLDSIKSTLLSGLDPNNLSRNDVFPRMYELLNPKEQEYLAMTLTAIGEAGVLAPPLEEMVAIMKVLENRKNYAQERGFPTANELDAALQPWQFSMYNAGAHHWSSGLNQTNSEPQTINAIRSYILFQNTHYAEENTINQVYHYHTNYVSPDWRDDNKIVRPEINGTTLRQRGTRHIFYRNIAWSFRHNNWSDK